MLNLTIVERNRGKYFTKFDDFEYFSDLVDQKFKLSYCLKLVPLLNLLQESVFYLQCFFNRIC